jgi:hypothetical protein
MHIAIWMPCHRVSYKMIYQDSAYWTIMDNLFWVHISAPKYCIHQYCFYYAYCHLAAMPHGVIQNAIFWFSVLNYHGEPISLAFCTGLIFVFFVHVIMHIAIWLACHMVSYKRHIRIQRIVIWLPSHMVSSKMTYSDSSYWTTMGNLFLVHYCTENCIRHDCIDYKWCLLAAMPHDAIQPVICRVSSPAPPLRVGPPNR